MAPSRTRLYVLLGNPVEHSLSPALHSVAIRELGLDAVYIALPVVEERVQPIMRTVAEAGGGGNVTVPHKRVAARALDDSSPAVRATGACNLFWFDPDRGLCGDNSDAEAFRQAAESVLGFPLAEARLLVLGAGGAARAVVYAATQSSARQLDILNRTRSTAEALVRDLTVEEFARVLRDPEEARSNSYELIVNATSLGLQPGDPLPIDLDGVAAGAVLDLVYGPEGTPWVREAHSRGLRAEDGRRMLVLQAAEAFERWFGRPAPVGRMGEAVGLGRTPSGRS